MGESGVYAPPTVRTPRRRSRSRRRSSRSTGHLHSLSGRLGLCKPHPDIPPPARRTNTESRCAEISAYRRAANRFLRIKLTTGSHLGVHRHRPLQHLATHLRRPGVRHPQRRPDAATRMLHQRMVVIFSPPHRGGQRLLLRLESRRSGVVPDNPECGSGGGAPGGRAPTSPVAKRSGRGARGGSTALHFSLAPNAILPCKK
jgi:hypothetical protein